MMNVNLQRPAATTWKPDIIRDVLDAALAVHEHLAKANVRHAFCGTVGLTLHRKVTSSVLKETELDAVEMLSARCPRDIDVLLGEEAFDIEHDVVVARAIPVLASGIRVNALPALGAWQQLLVDDVIDHVDVGLSDALPVLSLRAMIAMKLSAKTVRDDADIVAWVSSGQVDVGACMDWLRERRFDIARFDRLLSRVR